MSPQPQHIIISRTDNIGDVVLTLPLAQALKAAWPACKVSVLARPYVQAVVQAHPAVDQFIDWEHISCLPKAAAKRALAQQHADTILIVFPQRQIAQLAYRARIPRRIGTSRRWYHWLYCNRRVSFSRKKSTAHEAALNMRLLQALGLAWNYTAQQLAPWVQLKPAPLPDNLQRKLDPQRFTLILHPFSNGHGREWPTAQFVQLCQVLDPLRYQIIITGSKAEQARLPQGPWLQAPHVTSWCGQLTLSALLSLLAHADGVIASSTGPLHMAAACGSRTLGLFPKQPGIDPKRWGPVGLQATAITCQAPCTGCTQQADCRCMQRLQVASVSAVIKAWYKDWQLQHANINPSTPSETTV